MCVCVCSAFYGEDACVHVLVKCVYVHGIIAAIVSTLFGMCLCTVSR